MKAGLKSAVQWAALLLYSSTSSKNDFVHGDVVWLGKGVGHDLFRGADADFQGVGAGVGEDAVVVALAAAEAGAGFIESEAGAEEDVDFGGRDFREGGGGFADGEISGKEVGGGL